MAFGLVDVDGAPGGGATEAADAVGAVTGIRLASAAGAASPQPAVASAVTAPVAMIATARRIDVGFDGANSNPCGGINAASERRTCGRSLWP
jgi:hypothetical protein